MRHPGGLVVLASMSAAVLTAALPIEVAAEEEENFEYHTVTTAEGLQFRVPEDMPIENRGGIVGPIPFDEYIYAKFRKLEVKVKRLEARLAECERLLEERSKEKTAPAPPAPPQ